ncbi:MAG: glutaminyl-peptide cyclotransferase [Parvularculaceae bacterium]|nr:glutaminyl-peptide cyclotransferase [Parvularculaceae bacterium]
MKRRFDFVGLWGGLLAALLLVAPAAAQKRYDVEVVAVYPHDSSAFTQGLFFKDGALFESTGLEGASTLRRVKLETGEVLQKASLPPGVFGEGVAPFGDKILALTWRHGTGFVYDAETFREVSRFTYVGEGWGLTSDGKRLIMSDGTDVLRILDPSSFAQTGRIQVVHKGKPLRNLNELEWIDGEIFANVWMTDYIVRINPETGEVVGVIDAKALRAKLVAEFGPAHGPDAVLNGLAWDAEGRRLFVTGKMWPRLFEVRLTERKR